MKPLMTVRKPSPDEINMAREWDTWEKEPSEFPWYYDQKETCYIIEGKAKVTAPDGSEIEFGAGDWVVFEPGLRCTWKITEKIRKHYLFG